MKLYELTNFLESHAPLSYQESYDNSGLIVGHPAMDVNGAVVALDATEEVVNEAIRLGANLVIAHHPIVFSGLKRFNGTNYVQRCVQTAIKHDIAIYAIHTNLDNVLTDGVNTQIAKRLGLHNLTALRPFPGPLQQEPLRGAGITGILNESMPAGQFLAFLKASMKASVIRHTQPLDRPVSRVAVCGGSGSFLLQDAIIQNADVFITADFKYHEFFDANGQIMIADIGHYESEQFTIDLIKELIIKKFSNFALYSTKIVTNPINYF